MPRSGIWSEVKLNEIVCWVRMINFHPKVFTLNNVKRLGNLAGRVVEVNWENTKMILMKREVRVKIAFPIFTPIVVGKYILVEGTKHWIQFKFDLLPLICYKCGWLGHDQSGCNRNQVMVEEESTRRKVPLCGGWLKT